MVSPLWGPAYPTGSGIYAYELCKRLAEQGNDVHAFTSTVGHFNGFQYPENLHLHAIRHLGLLWDMNPISSVFSKILLDSFDIVHIHSYVFFMSNSAAMTRAFRQYPCILNIHGGINYAQPGMGNASKYWVKEKVYDKTLGRMTVRLADKVLSVSKSDLPAIRRKFGVDAEYVPNAVSTDVFTQKSNDSTTVTYVGKLEEWKGTGDLVKVFEIVQKEVKGVRFRVVGEGSLSEHVGRSGMPIEILGHVPHHKIASIYQSSALTILPSYMEGCPTCCMESLACGVPVIATNVGDTQEIVKDGRNGFIRSPGDIKGMAGGIISLLQDEGLRKRMGSNGRKHMVDNFSFDSVFERMSGIYSSLACDGSGLANRSLHYKRSEVFDGTERG